eukprot:CAMPEP_0203868600 /NCGR_PEP_ID=MMETSP0359-20131031/17198_1 /ASSEMBLY_ACC=CAM_ASM_000338 /TAXON_ID=268821 /ORGANISM="Scrippsiella Hangoei, Strain SHTV-5" /LENGTH=483 /DNA_ID=CAMNT_0050787037 /DNA_START=71 /DNA_END=1522 /DNA_ORIENTATION=-
MRLSEKVRIACVFITFVFLLKLFLRAHALPSERVCIVCAFSIIFFVLKLLLRAHAWPSRSGAGVVLKQSFLFLSAASLRNSAAVAGSMRAKLVRVAEAVRSSALEAAGDIESGLPPKTAFSFPLPRGTTIKRVRFNHRVSAIYVKDLIDESADRKTALWWQQADFEKFLQDRVDIAKAYRAAAKKKGLNLTQVSTEHGTHADEGYRAMLEVNPRLKDESRRGLGLGLKRQRTKNRVAYIAVVVEEQTRQLEAATSVPFRLDVEVLAAAAQRASAQDLEHAHHMAGMDFEREQAREQALQVASCETSKALEGQPILATHESFPWQSEGPEDYSGLVHSASFSLNDELEPTAATPGNLPPPSQSFSSKGFGLSREKLQNFGLSATGRTISLYKRLRQLNIAQPSSQHSDLAGESDGKSTDEDGLNVSSEHAEYLAQYRNWRRGALVRAGMPGYSDIKTYGTRQEYRVWRAWQATPVRARTNSDTT